MSLERSDSTPPALRLVAVALIHRDDGPSHAPVRRYLVARRRLDAHLGGAWELPGGRVEPGESPAEALARECAEELGLTGVSADDFQPLSFSHHVYPPETGPTGVTRPARAVLLLCHALALPPGSPEPQPLASDGLAWLRRAELLALPMPAANAALLSPLREGRG